MNIPGGLSKGVRADLIKTSIAANIGTTIEWYDFFIYEFAAVTVFHIFSLSFSIPWHHIYFHWPHLPLAS